MGKLNHDANGIITKFLSVEEFMAEALPFFEERTWDLQVPGVVKSFNGQTLLLTYKSGQTGLDRRVLAEGVESSIELVLENHTVTTDGAEQRQPTTIRHGPVLDV